MHEVDPFDDVDIVGLQDGLGQHASQIGYQDYGESGEGLQFYFMGRQATVLVRVRLVKMEDRTWRPFLDIHPAMRRHFKRVGIILEEEEYYPDEFSASDKLSMWKLAEANRGHEANEFREAG